MPRRAFFHLCARQGQGDLRLAVRVQRGRRLRLGNIEHGHRRNFLVDRYCRYRQYPDEHDQRQQAGQDPFFMILSSRFLAEHILPQELQKKKEASLFFLPKTSPAGG